MNNISMQIMEKALEHKIKNKDNLLFCKQDGTMHLENSINSAFKEFKPSYIADYIYNICVLMNSFYQNNHIANLEDYDKLNQSQQEE